jgi:hypothetical protein
VRDVPTLFYSSSSTRLGRRLCVRPPACDPCSMSRVRSRSVVVVSAPAPLPLPVSHGANACPPAVCLRSARPAITPAVARPHTSTVALQLSILYVAASRRRLRLLAMAARRGGEGVDCEGAALLAGVLADAWHAGRMLAGRLGVDCEYPFTFMYRHRIFRRVRIGHVASETHAAPLVGHSPEALASILNTQTCHITVVWPARCTTLGSSQIGFPVHHAKVTVDTLLVGFDALLRYLRLDIRPRRYPSGCTVPPTTALCKRQVMESPRCCRLTFHFVVTVS